MRMTVALVIVGGLVLFGAVLLIAVVVPWLRRSPTNPPRFKGIERPWSRKHSPYTSRTADLIATPSS